MANLNNCFNSTNTPQKEANFYKLPYLGDISKSTKGKLKELCMNYCKDLNITISFTTCKIGSFISSKSKSPDYLKSFVVYLYKCGSCNANYVGRTKRHFSVRIKEHLGKDKNSHIYKHINSNDNCKMASNESSFRIVDKANTDYQLQLKEAMHIQWIAPSINKQFNHVSISLHL